ncbi:hypothetical protein ERO13_D11G155700v2 [Gossypium hirsutum]|uniref:Uncharacterized protein n=1 Tax=Gossypium tomentosum TaxID=34277 RepID=A0A5D2INN1_GOSTO|nr:hypothetical protein ERO13_D11G155700v2 [Gossypium hirsutum]TYH44078.1 hypothetical protein ES332_D11G169000v1 [Gossypium tomentosum]
MNNCCCWIGLEEKMSYFLVLHLLYVKLRGPNDVANLAYLLGLSMERAKAVISKNCRSLLTNALRRKHFFKEAIRVEAVSSSINLWNLEISNQSFNIVDVKPANMEDLTEVITSAEFHPTHCNMLAYSSSKGSIRLIDLRHQLCVILMPNCKCFTVFSYFCLSLQVFNK